MKLSNLVGAIGLLSVIETSVAYPGMGKTVTEIKARVIERRQVKQRGLDVPRQTRHKRAIGPRVAQEVEPPEEEEVEEAEGEDDEGEEEEPEVEEPDNEPPPVLIGDIKDGGTTPIGKTIARILLEQESGESMEGGYKVPGLLGTQKCKKDTCCTWWYIARAMDIVFRGPSGRCNKFARAAVRLAFHDAGTWSQVLADQGKDWGGADGSIALSNSEEFRPENNGLQDIIKKARVWQKTFGVGMGDLIQFAANHAVVTCPLGPRVRTFVGRKDSKKAAIDGLLPGVNDSADKLIKLFQDKTISPHELVALLGAHTTSEQFFVDPKRRGDPQDGTPGVWDTLFYNQTIGTGPLPKKVFRFASDIAISQDPRTADEWAEFAGPGGQDHWNEDWAYSFIRLSLLGVNNINQLTECTKVLPMPRKTFKGAMELLKNE